MIATLLCSVGTWAQTWTSGAVAADDGEYYLYNIGAERFLNRGGTWSTHAIADGQGLIVKLDEKSTGVYSIYTAVNSKYLNGDYTDGDETNWTFESVSVEGYTNAYKLKNTDPKYLYWVGGGSGSWGNELLLSETITDGNENNFYWLLIPKATRQNFASASTISPLDVTYLITNPDFEYQLRDNPATNEENGDKPWTPDWGHVTQGWTTGGFWRQNSEQTFANGIFFEKYSGDGLTTADKIYQSVSLSVAGKYRLSCTAYSRNVNYYLYAGTQSTKITDSNTYSVDFVVSGAGSVEIGTKIETGSTGDWVAFDNVRLSYIDPYISVTATDFTSGSEMAAGKWYKFTVTTAGDYGFDRIDGVILTTNGNQLLSEATGDALTHEVTLATGTTYYIKSTTTQTVTKTSSPYTYTIGTGATNKSYIQAGNEVTISYASMTTTNTYTSELDTDISGVTFDGNAISVTRTAKGFKFTVPAVTAGTDYTLAIPAGVIGYKANSSGTNAAQNITLKTPAVLDGVYFFKANSTWNATTRSVTAACGKYLARGNASGTHATIDKYGLPIIVTTDADNATTIQPADTKKYYYHHNPGSQNWHCWADRTTADNDVAKFNITLHDGEYRIHNVYMASGTYFKYNNSDVNEAIITVYDDGSGTNSGPIINWTLETPAEHATYLQGLKDSQAATAATAAYNGGSGSFTGIDQMSALVDKLACGEYDETSIVSSSDITSTTEKYEDSQADTPKNVYEGSVEIETPGLYRFSMQAFYRMASNDVTQPIHEGGYDFPPVVLYFGSAETQIKSVYDESSDVALTEKTDWTNLSYNGAYYPNDGSTALAAFQADMYHNDVYLYVSEAGTYEYGVKYLGYAAANSQWFIYSPQSVSITLYTEADADETDKSELLATINGKVLGFEDGEYAPYNNVEAVEILNDAKDVYNDADALKWEVNAAIEAIEDATWTANDGEVNAFCGGDFSEYKTEYNATDKRNEDYPLGWNLYHGDSNRSRVMGGTEGGSNAGLSATSSSKALLLKFNGTYGETEGYTMPLKAGKIYKITFKHGKWAETRTNLTNVVMTDPSGASITLAPGFLAETDDCEKDKSHWYTYTGYFASTTAGDYKFNINKTTELQMQTAIGDIDLRTAENIPFADDAVPTYAPGTYPSVKITRSLRAGRWATAVYPFAVSGVDKIAVLDNYNTETQHIRFTSAEASTANEPFLMRSTTDKSEISLSNVEVSATSANPTVTSNNLSLIGTYSEIDITDAQNNYVLSANTIYPVGDKGAKIPAFRAYIQDANTYSLGRSLKFVVDEEVTAIEGISDKNYVNGTVYNLNGQVVRKNASTLDGLKKGVYIVNGQRVIVK